MSLVMKSNTDVVTCMGILLACDTTSATLSTCSVLLVVAASGFRSHMEMALWYKGYSFTQNRVKKGATVDIKNAA